MKNKLYSFLCLARRANAACFGSFVVENAVKSNKAKLVIIAEDASFNTKKKAERLALQYGIKVIYVFKKEEIGRAAGKDVVSVAAVTDAGFSRQMQKINNGTLSGGEGL